MLIYIYIYNKKIKVSNMCMHNPHIRNKHKIMYSQTYKQEVPYMNVVNLFILWRIHGQKVDTGISILVLQ